MSTSWEELSKQLQELQEKFVRTAQKLDESKRACVGVCGSWSPKKVLAHLSGWDKEVTRQFQLFQHGQEEAVEQDIDEFNKKSVQEREHLSWEETLNELKEVHEQFNLKAGEITLADISNNEEYINWMNVQIDHYQHHLKQLEEWV